MTLPTSQFSSPSDAEILRAFRRRRDVVLLRPVIERHLALVYSSALRRTGSVDAAVEISRAVFLVLARRARRLPSKTVLAEWLFQLVHVAVRKRQRMGWWKFAVGWFRRAARTSVPTDAPLWVRLSPVLDSALERLPVAQRRAMLVHVFQGLAASDAAAVLRVREKKLTKLVARATEKFRRRLRGAGVEVDSAALRDACCAQGCQPLPDTALVDQLVAAFVETGVRRPADVLARRVLNTLAWTRWRRRVVFGVPAFVASVILLLATIWIVEGRDGHSRLISMFLVGSIKHEGRTVPGLASPARPWPGPAPAALPTAHAVRTARDLYQTTNIWLVHLSFSADQWEVMQPKRITPLPHFMQRDGTVLLRNPEAQRGGLAGVLGFDFDWAHADLDFSGLRFTNVAARIKGNGTFLGSLYGEKRSLKVDLNKFVKGQRLGDVDELTLNNLINDYSSMSDALAYEFFRDAGVPAPRTAYAYVDVSVEGKWPKKPLGLYAMVEPVDADFALDHFGSRRTPIFKPVTYQLFHHLGDDWSAYADIYDLKTKATTEQQQRVVDFSRLLTHAADEEFARRVGEFLDLEKFARYLACEVLLSNYDSFLSNGQNFHLYLDPTSNKFGFIPWDLDLSWGGFFLLGTNREREQASIWHPWVGRHRLLERIIVVKSFRELYRANLEELLVRQFVPERLHRRIDELAAVIRGPVAAESDFRLGRFEHAISGRRQR
ncbi:MAG: CotH kinase family protein, partial [Verrucomicrobia bacterium]|nr:CotH kinase family protein [Verrucomicrobiota bacterium]